MWTWSGKTTAGRIHHGLELNVWISQWSLRCDLNTAFIWKLTLTYKPVTRNATKRWTESTMAHSDNSLHCWSCKPVQVLSIGCALLSIRKTQRYDIGLCTCSDIYICSNFMFFHQLDETKTYPGVKYDKRDTCRISTKFLTIYKCPSFRPPIPKLFPQI